MKNTCNSIPHKTISTIVLLGVSCLFYFYVCLLQISPNVISKKLMHDLSITGNALGILSGIYFYSYSLMQLPVGILMDCFNTRYLMCFSSIMCTISITLFAITKYFYVACFERLMLGFGSSFAAIGSMKLASYYLSRKQFSIFTGIMVTIGTLGSICGETPLMLLVNYFGWRISMILFGIVGVILSILILVCTSSKSLKSIIDNNKILYTSKYRKYLLINMKNIIKNKRIWIISIYSGLMYISIPTLCGLWGIPFIESKMHVNENIASNCIIFIFIGSAIASPIYGIYSYKVKFRKFLMYFGNIISLITIIIFIYFPIHILYMIKMLLFIFGFFSTSFISSFLIVKETFNKFYTATCLSFMNMINMFGISIIQPIIGYILDKTVYENAINNMYSYSIQSYHLALSILPLCIFISLMLLIKIKE